MKTIQLIWFHLKRIVLHNPGTLITSFVMPFVIIAVFLFAQQSDSDIATNEDIAVINHSSFVSENIVPQLDSTTQEVFTDQHEVAFEQLDQAEIAMIYEIPAEFPTNTETITVHSINGTNRDLIFENAFLSTLSDVLVEDAYNEANITVESVEVAQPEVTYPSTVIDDNLAFILYMVAFFLGYTSGIIGSDLAKMRKENLLRRSLVSNSTSWQILGSVLAAYIIYNFLASSTLIVILSLMFNVVISNIPLIISILLSMNIFVTGLTMLLFRIFKNEQIILILGMLFVIVLVFLPLSVGGLEQFSVIQYISPYYWLFDALDTGRMLPHTLIISLYGIILFTAGSFKIERLAKA